MHIPHRPHRCLSRLSPWRKSSAVAIVSAEVMLIFYQWGGQRMWSSHPRLVLMHTNAKSVLIRIVRIVPKGGELDRYKLKLQGSTGFKQMSQNISEHRYVTFSPYPYNHLLLILILMIRSPSFAFWCPPAKRVCFWGGRRSLSIVSRLAALRALPPPFLCPAPFLSSLPFLCPPSLPFPLPSFAPLPFLPPFRRKDMCCVEVIVWTWLILGLWYCSRADSSANPRKSMGTHYSQLLKSLRFYM